MGFILIALLAGISPANIPAITSTPNAASAIPKLISGFRKNNSLPESADFINIWFSISKRITQPFATWAISHPQLTKEKP